MLIWTFLAAAAEPSAECTIDWEQRFEAGQLTVSGDMVNLRAGPSTSSDIKGQLRLGMIVEAEECIKEEEVGGKKGCWHKVQLLDWEEENSSAMGRKKKRAEKGLNTMEREGYLFSTTLTDCTLFFDWDGDQVEEEIFSSMLTPGQVQIRVRDPDNSPHIFWLTTEAHGDIEGPSLSARISTIDQKEGGVPFVLLHQLGAEACGGYAKTHYFSYQSSLGILAATSTTSGGDSPAYYSETVELSPDKTMIYTTEQSDDMSEETSQQKHCFEKGIYSPCGEKTKTTKVYSEEELGGGAP